MKGENAESLWLSGLCPHVSLSEDINLEWADCAFLLQASVISVVSSSRSLLLCCHLLSRAPQRWARRLLSKQVNMWWNTRVSGVHFWVFCFRCGVCMCGESVSCIERPKCLCTVVWLPNRDSKTIRADTLSMGDRCRMGTLQVCVTVIEDQMPHSHCADQEAKVRAGLSN